MKCSGADRGELLESIDSSDALNVEKQHVIGVLFLHKCRRKRFSEDFIHLCFQPRRFSVNLELPVVQIPTLRITNEFLI